ncbi:hypothetical protein P170DRAFT_184187 [Aspergillus steynii IBT 23096]|uniref:Uncharacterized protein n=1 Tax=Aspergillus steynii IBT 23096 TaxID=1392250 RepID=A0A2I2G978_9EURO|nr:uncharacterized protein P170DRAFT_184187 [Aspergillus steynii IBT 23096]PLB49434.1 hypothetical protein P170DRAFT_184187 [Aspergillus steynii IBT 23096]
MVRRMRPRHGLSLLSGSHSIDASRRVGWIGILLILHFLFFFFRSHEPSRRWKLGWCPPEGLENWNPMGGISIPAPLFASSMSVHWKTVRHNDQRTIRSSTRVSS